jgi:Fe-S-cluster containining protein
MNDAARRRLRAHFRLVDEGVAPVVARYREHVQCRAGCSDCCHQTFRISEIEGELLREALDAAPPAVRDDIVARADGWREDVRTACPVLGDDGRCRLYDARPRICRKYGIPLWHPDRPHEVRTCPLNFRGMTDIDAELVLDPQAEWARDWIRLRRELGLTASARDHAAPIAHHLRTRKRAR